MAAAAAGPLADGGLGDTLHRDALLTPARHLPGHWISFTAGAFDSAGAPLPELAHRRAHVVARADAPPEGPVDTWPGEHLYGGVLFGHYGHFLMESLARAWAFDRRPDLPIVWHVHANQPEAGLTGWQRDVLALLGLGGRQQRFVHAPVRIETLHVPEAGSILGASFHPVLAARLATFPFALPAAGRRIWLSRSGLRKPGGRIEGEAVLEALLAARGWSVFRPEAVPVGDQLAAMSDAEVIAGFAGSAFHTLVLAQAVRARILILARGAPAMLRNYAVPAQTRGFAQAILPLPLVPVSTAGAARSWRLDEPARALGVLEDALPRAGQASC